MYTVEFNELNKEETLSSPFEVTVVDDKLTSAMEAFKCVVVEPTGDNVEVGEFSSVTVGIEDNDGE